MTTQLYEKCLVTLRYDREARGRIARLGPEQSIVRWANGNETCVVNDWVEPLPEDGSYPTMIRVERKPNYPEARVAHVASNLTQLAKEEKPRRAAPDDDIVDRLKAMTPEQVKAFAIVNGVWDDKYDALPNPGLRRMNVINRLRAKINKGNKVVWS